MFLNEYKVKSSLSIPSLLNVLADLLRRYSKHDPSLQQPIRSVLSIENSQK